MITMLDLLRDAGGELPSSVVFERLRTSGQVRPADLLIVQRSGETRFAKEVRFARLELVHAGLFEAGAPGQWSLSDAGWATFLTIDEAQALISRRRHGTSYTPQAPSSPSSPRPTTGPRPVSFTATVVRVLAQRSWAYVFRFGDAELWKIGHTQNLAMRLAEVNRHVPIELIGVNWGVFARRACCDSIAAYELEQRLLTELANYRTQGERVRCQRERMIAAWRCCGEAGWAGASTASTEVLTG